MKCCHFTFGAALTWEAADETGFAWWFGLWHQHRREWYYEVVTLV